MSKQTLKEQIDANITSNGLQQITGAKLNAVMNSVVDEMIEPNDVILASEKGAPNGVATLDANGNLAQGITTGSSGNVEFQGSGTDLDPLEGLVVANGVVAEGNTGIVSGGEVSRVFDKIGVKFGIAPVPEIINIAPELVSPDFNNSSIWRNGLFLSDGSPSSASSWKSIIEYKKVYKGQFKTNLYFAGNAHMVIYDDNYNIVRTIGNKGNQTGSVVWEGEFLEGEKYVRFSRRTYEVFNSYINQTVSDTTPDVFTDKVFFLNKNKSIFKSEIIQDVNTELYNYGLRTTDIGYNFLSELTNSNYTNVNIWVQNYLLLATGVPSVQNGFYYTKNYYEILPNTSYRFRNRYNGNAKCLIYNKNKEVIQVLENLTSTWLQDINIVTHSEAKYIRLTMRENYTTSILLSNNNIIYNSIAPIDEVKLNKNEAISSKGVANNTINIDNLKTVSKPNHKVVTFISDDGRAGNLTWFLPMMEQNNCRATLAIVGSWMNGGQSFTTMTRQEIRTCYNNGHDIASHTNTHPYMTQITSEQLDDELYRSRFALAEIGINAKMFVAPFGSRSTEVDKTLRKYFETDFITVTDSTVSEKTCVNLPIIDRYNLKRISFDASNNTDSRLEICKQAVDVLIEKGGWLVFAIHPHYNEYLQSGNPTGYEARRQELQDLITYIRSKEINILPANLAYEYYKNRIQIGDLRLDDKYFIKGIDNSVSDTLF